MRETPNNQVLLNISIDSGAKRHPLDEMFKSVLSKTNLAAPPLDVPTALKILNI